MRIAADTNVLLRAFLHDDPTQAEAAVEALDKAELVAIGLACFCEFVWVLQSRYGVSPVDIQSALHRLLGSANVVCDRAGVEAGLSMMQAGGDFADGVIAYEGCGLGGETFTSFDKKAVRLLARQGRPVAVPQQP